MVTKPFERVWTDLKGKLKADFWGNRYMVTFTCELTRWTVVYFCKYKSDVRHKLVEFLRWVERNGHAVRILNSDGGREYTANENATLVSEFQKICLANNIEQQFTSAYTSAQNGISERMNRTLVEHATCLLYEAGLSPSFWSLAVKHATWLRNRIWTRSLSTDKAGVLHSPFQRLFGRIPSVAMARVWGCDAWSLNHGHVKSSFEPKGQKMIFVGLSANRKGWVLFNPRTRQIATTYHCIFDESFELRRCALRDFKLRQDKAGPGASRDEERLAKLEAELYEFEETPITQEVEAAEGDDVEGTDHLRSNEPERSDRVLRSAAEEAYVGPSSGDESESVDGDEPSQSDTHVEEMQPSQPAPGAGVSKGFLRTRETRRNGGRNGTPISVVVPQRRVAIGKEQELSEDDANFLEFAFEHDLPMQYLQRNMKLQGSASRKLYEGYKVAHTLREAKHLGARWQDIVWDFNRGFIDFQQLAGQPTLEELIEKRRNRGIEVSAAAWVDEFSNVRGIGQFGAASIEDSIKQDYALMALEHLESQSHRTQELLKRALAGQSLAEFAWSCASRIMIPEPLTVVEAMASEHAAEWRNAMDEEMGNISKFACFERVAKEDAQKHGRLVKSKWVFKVKYNSDGTLQRFRARLVAKGFTQVPGSDFYETFSPVFGYTSLRTILAIAAARDLQLDQWYLKNSLLQQDIDVEHMYMECPDGYSKVLGDGRAAALHCLKSIYGLKQSSRLLHERLSKHLISQGFRQLVSDRVRFCQGIGKFIGDCVYLGRRYYIGVAAWRQCYSGRI